MKFATIFAIALGAVSCYAQCQTGSALCCTDVKAYDNAEKEIDSLLTSLTGIDDPKLLKGQIGYGCNPISLIGIGSGSSCTAQPVCCEFFGGSIAARCTPINANL